jgi:AraC-like DNA-binding protein
MSPSGSRPADDSRETTYDVWRLNTVNLFQGIIGATYGFVEVDRVAAAAKELREPATPGERSHAREVVFESLLRKIPTMSATEALRAMQTMNEFSKTCRADITKVVSDLRTLLHLEGPVVAEQIRDVIDREYARNRELIVRQVASHFDMAPKQAKAEFERRFGTTVGDYTMHRRIAEGMALIRAGMKIDAVANEVGFRKGKRHFYAAFRKITGMTPGAHRRRERDDDRKRLDQRHV